MHSKLDVKKIGGVSSSMKARGAPCESLDNATIVKIRNTRDTDSVFRYESFSIFLVFSYRIPKGNSVGKFGIIKLAGALYTHGDHTRAPSQRENLGGGASAREGKLRRLLRVRQNSPPLLQPSSYCEAQGSLAYI